MLLNKLENNGFASMAPKKMEGMKFDASPAILLSN